MSESPKAVFLSYAREDTDAARRIAEALRGFGVEVWFDQNELRGGDSWDAKIKKQIRECALFMAVVSTHTQERAEGYFRREWKLAVERTNDMAAGVAFLVPVVVDDTPEVEALVPEEFMRVQWTRLAGALPTPEFVAQVKSLLGAALTANPMRTRPPMTPLPPLAPKPPPPPVEAPPPPKKSGSSAGIWIALVVLLLAGGAAAWYFFLRTEEPAAPPPKSKATPAAKPSSLSPSPSPPPQAADKSIAVLPFSNMSEDKDSTFFADGMHEDILTNLAVIRDLRVTSRTSVMEYRGTTKKIRQIGAELGVAYVLEGSVRRAGNKVRVTGQLINAHTDEHVWAKSYDRDLTDIFAIQSELSQAIASALAAVLTPQEKSLLEARPTTSLAAYDLFLKARAWHQGYDNTAHRGQVEQWLHDAVKLDPAFAQAWALLSNLHLYAYIDDADRTPERLAQAKSALDTAVQLAPGAPLVIECQGNYFYHGFKDYAQAAGHYRRLLVLNPNSAIAYGQLGFLERRQGRWPEALELIQKSVQLDPRNPTMVWEVGDLARDLRRYDAAAMALRQAERLAPEDPYYAYEARQVAFNARGSTREVDDWLAGAKVPAALAGSLLAIRRDWTRQCGDYATAVRLNQEHPYIEPYRDPRWKQEVEAARDLLGHHESAGAAARAQSLIPELQQLVEKQATNAYAWQALAWLHVIAGDRESALRCARRMKELLPESVDAKEGPGVSRAYAAVLAWTGDKDGALAELARLLRMPRGANVHWLRAGVDWLPLRGDPRFEALLNDPKNNAPLF